MNLYTLKNHLKIIPDAFGLDISDSSFKFIQLRSKGNFFTLVAFGEGVIPAGIIERGELKKPEKLSTLLREYIKEYKIKGLSSYAVASLPDEEVYLKTIKLPLLKKSEIYSAIQVEAERNMPIKADAVYLDYSLLAIHKKKKHLDVLVAAAKKDIIDKYAEMLVNSGITPVVIEPEVSAISRAAIKGNKVGKAVIIVEIGANRTRLIAFVNNSVVLTGSFDFSTKDVTSAIAKALGITEEQSAKLRWERKLLKDKKYGKKIEEAIFPIFERLADSINSYAGFLNDSLKEQGSSSYKVEKIIISGGGARIPAIEKNLSIILQKSVEIVNPWVNVLPYPIKETPELSYAESVKYTAAIGLALRGVRGKFK